MSEQWTMRNESAEALDGIERGGWREVVRLHAEEPAARSTDLDRVVAAEIALYLDRLDEIRESLAGISSTDITARGEAGTVVRRTALILAEVALLRGDTAARPFEELAAAAAEAGDRLGALRARYDVGRAYRKLGRRLDALEVLTVARDDARALGNAYYEGLVELERGSALHDLGDTSRARTALERALALLEASEGLRHFGVCLRVLGRVVEDSGDAERAVDMLARAEEIADRLGVVTDALEARVDMAGALVSVGRPAEAEARLDSVLGESHPPSLSKLELRARALLAIARCERGRYTEAAEAASECVRLASLVGEETDRLGAQLLLQRAKALAGDAEAADDLRRLVSAADERGNKTHRIEVRAYMAEVLRRAHSLEAARWLREALEHPGGVREGWLGAVVARIGRDLDSAPMRIGDRGELVIDPTLEWPPLEAVREAVDRYMFERAVAVAGNPTAAGRLIGQTAYQMFCLKRYLNGQTPRPSRSKKAGAVLQRRSRRRNLA